MAELSDRQLDPEYLFSELDEEMLLIDPIANASALYDLYEGSAKVHIERLEGGVESALGDLMNCFNRMMFVSKLLPDEDPRSYEAYKQRCYGQQG